IARGLFSLPAGTKRERADRSQDERRIAKTPWKDWSAMPWGDIVPGAQTERRSGAWPVRGLLGGKDPTGRFASTPILSAPDPRRSAHGLRQRNHFPAGPRAQSLERGQRCTVAEEAHGAVGEGEVGAARMAAAKGATPILQRGKVSHGRHP